jgi:hypothetical protein
LTSAARGIGMDADRRKVGGVDRSGEAVKIVVFSTEPLPKTGLGEIAQRDQCDAPTPAAARQEGIA